MNDEAIHVQPVWLMHVELLVYCSHVHIVVVVTVVIVVVDKFKTVVVVTGRTVVVVPDQPSNDLMASQRLENRLLTMLPMSRACNLGLFPYIENAKQKFVFDHEHV